MADPRILAYLRRIDAKLDAAVASHRADMLEVDAEQEQQNAHLAKHDDQLSDHDRRLARLERKVNGRASK